MRLTPALLCPLAALLLSACGGGEQNANRDAGERGASSGIPVSELPDRRSQLSAEHILAAVKERLPASAYMSNAYLPAEGDYARYASTPPAKRQRLRVGMPWIFSDGFSPLYVGIEQGYFSALGLDIEMVPGGPGRDHLQTLVGGQVDVAIVADGLNLPVFAASRTRGNVVGVASFLKKNPVAYLSLDPETPANQRSTRPVEVAEFAGKSIGVLRGRTHYVEFLVHEFGLDPAAVRVRWTGSTPDALLTGVVDHWAAWILDQPRLLEKNGHQNWRPFFFHDLGWKQYCDLVVVRRATADEDPETVRRFLAALHHAVEYYLAEPAASAAISASYAKDVSFTTEDVLRRYEAERPLVIGDDGLPLLHMDPARWDEVTALLVRYGIIEDRAFR